MIRGRKPKPTRLKLLEGNPGKRRIPNDPKPKPIAPSCPSWIPKEGKALWKQLAPKLERLGLLRETDGEAFAAMCLHWAYVRKAAARIAKDGIIAKGERGNVKHPAYQVVRDSTKIWQSLAASFGLTPADMARIDLRPLVEEEDEFAEWSRNLDERQRPPRGH